MHTFFPFQSSTWTFLWCVTLAFLNIWSRRGFPCLPLTRLSKWTGGRKQQNRGNCTYKNSMVPSCSTRLRCCGINSFIPGMFPLTKGPVTSKEQKRWKKSSSLAQFWWFFLCFFKHTSEYKLFSKTTCCSFIARYEFVRAHLQVPFIYFMLCHCFVQLIFHKWKSWFIYLSSVQLYIRGVYSRLNLLKGLAPIYARIERTWNGSWALNKGFGKRFWIGMTFTFVYYEYFRC